MKKNFYHKGTSVLINQNMSQKNNDGFTLIEMIVVIAIIAVISVLSMFNSSRLNSSVLLSNTAYEIGLIIRDAQISGLGARVMSTGGVATTSNQGVYFNTLEGDKIVFFADLNKSNSFDDSGEQSQIFNIENKRAGKVIKICRIANNGSCTEEVSDLTVMFKRPNPEAYFYTTPGEAKTTSGYPGSIAVNVGFAGGECRSIIIYKTGAVQIDKSFCN